MGLHKKLAAASIPADKGPNQRLVEATERQIAALVYESYGLTEKKIEIAEGAGAHPWAKRREAES